MGNPFAPLENDTVKIVSKDGNRVSKEFKAVVSSNQVTTFTIDIDVNEGDFVERTLPGGKTELYLISEANYSPGLMTIPPSYQLKVKKTTTLPKQGRVTNNYHITGDNSRIYNHSNDNSNNIYTINEDNVFNGLKALINDKIKDGQLITLVDDMEAAKGSKSFAEKYNNFIQAAANHMSLISPFIPQLTTLLLSTNA